MTREEFTSIVEAAAIGDVRCSGREGRLTDCFYISRPSCSELDDAGVVCQGKIWETVKITSFTLSHLQPHQHSMQSVLVET